MSLFVRAAAALAAVALVAAPASAGAQRKLPGVKVVRSETAVDPELERAVVAAAGRENLEGLETPARYYYNRVDLDGDGKPEVLVYLIASSLCGTGGCELFVFRKKGDGYWLVSNVGLVNGSIVVAPTRTKGWNDLVTYVAGGGINQGYSALRFNGKSYPTNTSAAPPLRRGAKVRGTQYLPEVDESEPANPGITLKLGST
jgi:hypothetical protein